jgi:glycosyltransferase involved in cell wall biosynthesis
VSRGSVDSATAAMRTATEGPAAFVMPHFADRPQSVDWLGEAVGALLAQTDPNWVLVIVDDASPNPRARDRLLAIGHEHVGKVAVLLQGRHRGAGACRKKGVRWADERGSPLVLFNDADDISHPRRLEAVKTIMRERPGVGFVYSSIGVIDERGVELARERLIPALQEILESP